LNGQANSLRDEIRLDIDGDKDKIRAVGAKISPVSPEETAKQGIREAIKRGLAG